MKSVLFGSLTLLLACSRNTSVSAVAGGSGGEARAFGGVVVEESEQALEKYLPYAVVFRTSVYEKRAGKTYYHTCGGAPIAPDMVAIDAHCLQGPREEMRAIFGLTQITPQVLREKGDSEMSRKIVGRDYHPLYTVNRYNPYDVAIVQLDRPVPPGTKIFSLGATPVSPQVFPQLKILGYGWSRATFEGDYDDKHQPVYKTDGDQKLRVVRQRVLPNFKVGVFSMDGRHGRGTCLGDSGGPVFKKIAEQFVLVGLTSERMSLPEEYDQCNVDSISVDIANVRDWMIQSMAGLRRDLQRKQISSR